MTLRSENNGSDMEQMAYKVEEELRKAPIIGLVADTKEPYEETRKRVQDQYVKALDGIKDGVLKQFSEVQDLITDVLGTMNDRTEQVKAQMLAHLDASEVAFKMSVELQAALNKIKLTL